MCPTLGTTFPVISFSLSIEQNSIPSANHHLSAVHDVDALRQLTVLQLLLAVRHALSGKVVDGRTTGGLLFALHLFDAIAFDALQLNLVDITLSGGDGNSKDMLTGIEVAADARCYRPVSIPVVVASLRNRHAAEGRNAAVFNQLEVEGRA